MNHQHLRPKNWNEHVIKYALIAAFVAFCVWLVSCQKEISSLRTPVIESDHHLTPPEGWNEANRPANYAETLAKGQGKGKGGGRPKGPKDTTVSGEPDTPPPPPVIGSGVIYLDMDGQYDASPYWGARYYTPANLTYEEQAAILQRVQSDYAEFAVTVTGDSTLYWSAPANKRMRVIVTESWEWYGQAGGVAYVGSFSWGNNTPCFVFSSLLGYSQKNISDAISHEAGHTLNLRHQGKCDGTQYNPDLAADGKGYLMGYPYPHISGWQVGVTPQCIGQDDRTIIKSNL